jgi:hypothetical protein
MSLQNKKMEEFRSGIYLHYKGNLYEADHLMRDANDNSRVGVHYIGIGVSSAQDGPRHLIRTWQDWNAVVHKDGTVCNRYKNGSCLDTQKPVVLRFRYLGPFYMSKMLDEEV